MPKLKNHLYRAWDAKNDKEGLSMATTIYKAYLFSAISKINKLASKGESLIGLSIEAAFIKSEFVVNKKFAASEFEENSPRSK